MKSIILLDLLLAATSVAVIAFDGFHHPSDLMVFVDFAWIFLCLARLMIIANDPLCPRPVVWLWKTIKWTLIIVTCGAAALFIVSGGRRSTLK